nr:hypothetical protein [Tanacetum cinerariifolium]
MDKLDQKVTLLKLTVEDLEFEFSNSLVDHPNSSRLKDIKAKYNGIIQNTDLSDFAYAIKDNSIHHESQYGNNEEQMFVKGTHEEKEEEILKKDLIEVNVLKVIKADSMAEKSTQDDIGNEYRENEMIIINKDEDEFNVFNEFKQFFRAESEIDVLKEDIKQDIKDASIRVQPKREPSITWYLKSHFQVRGSALNTYANTLSQTEVLTADTLFMMDDETDPIKYGAQLTLCAALPLFPFLILQDLKAQLQDKGIVISELKKLIEKLKGKSVDTKFETSSVIRQPNAFKS